MIDKISAKLLATAVLLAATLLACDGCRNHTPDAGLAEPESTAAGDLTCRPLAARTLDDSSGGGPIGLVGGPESALVAYSVGDGAGGQGHLHIIELDAMLQGLGTDLLDDETTGGLLPESLARSRNEVATVARQAGGRRIYFFERRDGASFERVETPQLGALDRRVDARLVEPRVGGGIQVVTHVSGSGQVHVGRLAGSILVTRSLDIPPLVVSPSAASTDLGELVLVTVEQLDEGQRSIRLREVRADATPGRWVEVAPADRGTHIERAEIVGLGESYLVQWLVRAGDASELQRALVDAVTLEVRLLEPIRSTSGLDSVTDFTGRGSESHAWTVWVEGRPGVSRLWVGATGQDGRDLGRHPLQEVEGGHPTSPQLALLGSHLVVAWRQLAEGQVEGPVWVAALPCAIRGGR